jgi:hypothetical protein
MSEGAMPFTFVVENLTRQRVIAARVQAANNSAQRRRGLLGVTDLDRDSGLWISPCEAVHTFGMCIRLDVIFLDGRLCVKKIAADLKPNRIAFCLSADSVLEMKAGTAAASGLERGDQLLLRRRDDSPTVPVVPTAPDGVIR